MLHKDPFLISPETLELIIRLQGIPELKDYILVGGTSLALQLGHRNSIDIDLFTQDEFDNNTLLDMLAGYGLSISIKLNVKNTIIGFIDGIKVDFIRHNFPFVNPPVTEEGITFLSCEDIGAMKLHAISNSGKRIKDFIDIYYLLERFSMEELIGFYAAKYTNYNPMIALRAVNYFDDIDPQLDPPKLRKSLSLDQIKKRIMEAVIHSKKRF